MCLQANCQPCFAEIKVQFFDILQSTIKVSQYQIRPSEEKEVEKEKQMQGTGANGSDDGGGEWERIGKKGKKEGLQASSKKGKKNSMKNARTLSLQAFYTEHGLPDDSVLEQAEGDQMAIGIGR